MHRTENASWQYITHVSNLSTVPIPFEVLAMAGRCFAEIAPTQPERGPKKQCFANAAQLARSTSGLHYVEGYAVAGRLMLPLAHAWCVDDEGRVYDPTWPDGRDYYGVVFDRDRVEDLRQMTGSHDVLTNLEALRIRDLDHIKAMLFAAVRRLP
jgi:hypothetical protein